MPDEVFVIILVAILAGTMMVAGIARSIFKYLSSRHQPIQAGSSLTAGELERLLREAVEEATAPLAAQIDALERRLDERRLLEAPPLLPEGDLSEQEAAPPDRRPLP